MRRINSESVEGSQEEGGRDGQGTALVATEGQVEFAPGETTDTWLYGDRHPGPELRVSEGDTLGVIVPVLRDGQPPGFDGMTELPADEQRQLAGIIRAQRLPY